MLHILFLILKIIGIILAIILGIIIFLLCIVFFVPVCYQGSAKCDGKLDTLAAIIKVTWLFRLIQVNAKFENNKLVYSVQIAWKKILGGKNLEKTKEVSEHKTTLEQPSPEPVKDKKVKKVVEEPKERVKSVSEKIEEESNIPEGSQETASPVEEKLTFTKKIKNLLDKIKCTIKNICDKLKMLLEKKDKVMKFIEDRNHIKAFKKAKKEVFRLLKRLRPKKFIVKARFGFEDPSLTGKILAASSLIYPFTEDHMELVPDFENQVLEGRLTIKGRIYVIHFVCLAWNLFWCKQVRMLYKDIRNFKF